MPKSNSISPSVSIELLVSDRHRHRATANIARVSVISSSPGGEREYCDEHACLCIGLSVCLSVSTLRN